MKLAAAAVSFGIVFPAELPDKSALASLVLGSRYRARWVFAGVAAAFAVHVAIALAAGSLLALLPHRVVEGAVAALFLIGAVLLLRGARGDDDEEQEEAADALEGENGPSNLRVAGASFAVVFLAEFGDLTQIVTANLAAHYRDPLAVGVGATLALWAVGGLAIVGGRRLQSLLSLVWITRVAAVAMIVMAGFSVVSAIRG